MVTRNDLMRDLVSLGLPEGGTVMVHSSLRSIGTVEGGADTVVEALLQCLGPEGTLVVPTFTFASPGQPGFIFDPAETRQLTGAQLFESAMAHYRLDPEIFARTSGTRDSPLVQGHTVVEGDRVMCVVDPSLIHHGTSK